MAVMNKELYEALLAANTPQDKAADAAESVASYEKDMSDLKGQLLLVRWMLGFNLAFTMAVLWKVFV